MSIVDASLNADGELVLSLSVGGPVNVGTVVGEPGRDGAVGEKGADGVGITDLELENDELIVTLSDQSTRNLGRIVGADGRDGNDGANGLVL